LADPFVAEIRIFPFNFAPRGWAWCDGQLLPLSQNTALFSLLGTMYGGDGKSTFALPDLQGRAPMFWGQGPGLSLHDEGETGGSETVTLLESEMPSHNHSLLALGAVGNRTTPIQNSIARVTGATPYVPTPPEPPLVSMSDQTIPPAGGGAAHNNLQPYLTFYFCIALQGVFPPRT
jgi:microcystin-dependent protein